jgi:subtilisin family serine protease
MPLKILDASGEGTVADEIMAIQYAVSNGANVINSSFGGYYGNSVFEKQAIEQAWKAGVIFVAAVGNSGSNNDAKAFYPASHPIPNMIAAASTEFNDDLSWFTNFGSESVHLGAPGEDIYSTETSDSYGFQSGSSMAASFVSGTVALLMANDSSLSALEAREVILASVDPKGSNTITGGRLNANKALNTNINSIPPVRPSQLKASSVTGYAVGLEWADNSVIEDGFVIERAPHGGVFSQIGEVGANVISAVDSGVSEGTTYYYRVYAFNHSYGASAYSSTVTAATPIVHEESGDGGDDGFCFIATTAYGSYLSPEVEVLRGFRDGVLLKFGAGRMFVEYYYAHSPALARYISGHGLLRAATRTALTPVVYGIKHPYACATLALIALCAILYRINNRRKES